MKFPSLVADVAHIHSASLRLVGQRVQQTMSLRNWLIGARIVIFEQRGEERAAYGARLLETLGEALAAAGCRGLSARNLLNCRQVALAYAELDAAALARRVLGPDADMLAPVDAPRLERVVDVPEGIAQTSAESSRAAPLVDQTRETRETPETAETPGQGWRDEAWIERLFIELTFSHLLELVRIEAPLQRAFYELHCLRERWSVRELIRQRNSRLYERVGLSQHRDEVLALARGGKIDERPEGLLRDPYVLEFLGMPAHLGVNESQLEQALIDHLQQFLQELGREFCFVERQHRVTVGNRHHHIDLLFFHRRLRCLVAIDLKVTEFEPAHAGQMRFYLNYLADNVALSGENPPVGLILCAEKDAEIVHYATASDAEPVLVARYLTALPSEEQLRAWLHAEREALLRAASLDRPAARGEDDA